MTSFQVGNKNIDNASGQQVREDIEATFKAVATNNFGQRDGAGTILPCEFLADETTNRLLIRSSSGGDQANPNPPSGTAAQFFPVGNLDEDNLGLLPKAGGTMSGALTLSAGAVGSPSLTVGDSTTGLYRRSSDQLGITIAGTQTAFFDADGLSILGQDDLRLYRNSNDIYVGIQASNSTSSNYTLTLPTTAGSDTQVLSTNGSGVLSWATAVPTGAIFCVAMLAAAPTGYVPCDGATYSTGGIYQALFEAIGHTYGGSGGSFQVPDLRGEFIRGLDNYGGTASSRGARGVDSGRNSVNDVQGSQMQQHNHSFSASNGTGSATTSNKSLVFSGQAFQISETFSAAPSPTGVFSKGSNQNGQLTPGNPDSSTTGTLNININASHDHTVSMNNISVSGSTGNQGGTGNSSENRPRNIAMMYIIKL